MEFRFNVRGNDLSLNLPPAGSKSHIGNPLHYLVLDNKGTSEEYLGNLYDLIVRHIPRNARVTELMGGIGATAKMVWNQILPSEWIIVDIDPECGEWQQEPRAKFICANAYDYPFNTEVLICDHGNGTLRTIAQSMDGRGRIYNKLKTTRPDYVLVTDFGHYWVHLPNHHPWYIKTFGLEGGSGFGKHLRDIYPTLWDQWFRDNLGYTVIDTQVGGGAQYFMMVPV